MSLLSKLDEFHKASMTESKRDLERQFPQELEFVKLLEERHLMTWNGNYGSLAATCRDAFGKAPKWYEVLGMTLTIALTRHINRSERSETLYWEQSQK